MRINFMNPQDLEKSTLTKVAWRLIPFICLLYVKERRRRSTQVSRKLQLLHAHGVIAPIRSSYRYRPTRKGNLLMNAAVSVRSQAFPREIKAVA